MEKNENGYPVAPRATEENRPAEKDMRRAAPQNDIEQSPRKRPCGEGASELDSMPLAYVYAPNQRFCMLYSASDALDRGTLFEQLYKPMEVYGRE